MMSLQLGREPRPLQFGEAMRKDFRLLELDDEMLQQLVEGR